MKLVTPRHRLQGFLPLLAGAFLAWLPIPAPAVRIPEPDTLLYGQIVERVGTRVFPITSGELVWNLRTAGPGGRDYRFSTRLERLAAGRYSYRLRIPHDLLAYDLEVKPGAVALAAAASRVQHLAITLDGRPLSVAAGAVDGFTLDASRRAGSVQVNLEVSGSSPDTDGDGVPDTWEDANGFDKYDPSDAPRDPEPATAVTTSSPTGSNASAAPVPDVPTRNFSEWRAAWFPNATGALETFGQEDPDHDGIPNFLEYAFGLDPTRADPDAASRLPRGLRDQGRSGITFRERSGVTDLVYQVQVSDDLIHWSSASADTVELTAANPEGTRSVVSTRSDDAASGQRFFRVQVNLR